MSGQTSAIAPNGIAMISPRKVQGNLLVEKIQQKAAPIISNHHAMMAPLPSRERSAAPISPSNSTTEEDEYDYDEGDEGETTAFNRLEHEIVDDMVEWLKRGSRLGQSELSTKTADSLEQEIKENEIEDEESLDLEDRKLTTSPAPEKEIF